MQSSHSSRTIVRQTITGIVCFIAGLGFVRLCQILADHGIELYWPDGSRHTFFMGAFVGYLAAIALTVYMSKSQFEEPTSPSGSFFSGITFGLGWTLLAVFVQIVFLMIVGWPGFPLIISEILFVVILFPLLGVIFGTIHAISQYLWRVDYAEEANLVSNKASVEACKAGVLPYAAQVRQFWGVATIELVSFLLLSMPIVALTQGARDPLIFPALIVSLIGLVAAGVFGKRYVDVVRNPQIKYVEGLVTKSTFRIKYAVVYNLRCNGKGFSTNSKIWEQIIENRAYRLWHIATNKRVVAYEPQGTTINR
jgi:hypothetical protein